MSPAEKKSVEALEDIQVNIEFALSREQLVADIRSDAVMDVGHLADFLGKFGLWLSACVILPDGSDHTTDVAQSIHTQLHYFEVHGSPTFVEANPNSPTLPRQAVIIEELDRLDLMGLEPHQAATHYMGAQLMERYVTGETTSDAMPSDVARLEFDAPLSS